MNSLKNTDDGQKAEEKPLITNYQKNKNQVNKILSHMWERYTYKSKPKKLGSICVGHVVKTQLLTTADGNVVWFSPCGKQYAVF